MRVRLVLIGMALFATAAAVHAVLSLEARAQMPADTRDTLRSYGRALAAGGGEIPEGMACLPCHGIAGEGDAETGVPKIAGLPALYLLKQLGDYAEERRVDGIMTPIAQAMTGRQRLGAALHYESLDPTARAQPAPRSEPARAQRGATLYVRGSAALGIAGCINCHGPEAIGTAASYPALAGQHASYVSAQLRAWREGTRRNSIAGVMEHIAGQLGEEDIDDMAAYLAALAPARLR